MDEAANMRADLELALSFLRGGVRRPELEQGLRVIEALEQRLAASGSPELSPVAESLAELRVILLAGDFDPAAVGRLLKDLGEQTQAVGASEVGAPVTDELSELAALLAEEGDALSGA